MKYKDIIVAFSVGFLIGGLGSHAIVEMKIRALRTDMEKLRGEILTIQELIRPFEQASRVNFKVTAYSNDDESINVPAWRDGITATGTIAVEGTVASDWQVMEPGTKIYIPGYGIGTVEDRGGKVRGRHLDVFFDTREKAVIWGVKRIDVLVADNSAW